MVSEHTSNSTFENHTQGTALFKIPPENKYYPSSDNLS